MVASVQDVIGNETLMPNRRNDDRLKPARNKKNDKTNGHKTGSPSGSAVIDRGRVVGKPLHPETRNAATAKDNKQTTRAKNSAAAKNKKATS